MPVTLYLRVVFVVGVGLLLPMTSDAQESATSERSPRAKAREFFNMGLDAENADKFDEAIAYFKKADEQVPDTAAFLYHLGLCHELAGRSVEAVDYFRRVVADQQQPEQSLDAQLRLERLVLPELSAEQRRQLIEATDLLQKADELRTGLPGISAATVCAKDAIALLEGLNAEISHYPPLYSRLGEGYLIVGSYDKAVDAFQLYIDEWKKRGVEPVDLRKVKSSLAEARAFLVAGKRELLLEYARQAYEDGRYTATKRYVELARGLGEDDELKEFESIVDEKLRGRRSLLSVPVPKNAAESGEHQVRYTNDEFEHRLYGVSEFAAINSAVPGPRKFPGVESILQYNTWGGRQRHEAFHIVVINQEGCLWHAMRNTDGTWLGWGNASQEMGITEYKLHAIFYPGDIPSGESDGTIRVPIICVEGAKKGLLVCIRKSSGAWELESFQEPDNNGNVGRVNKVRVRYLY